jgi:hypothetical protein
VRYRRYYVSQRKDGSVTVVSHGPIVGWVRFWFRFFVVAFVAIYPAEQAWYWTVGSNLDD